MNEDFENERIYLEVLQNHNSRIWIYAEDSHEINCIDCSHFSSCWTVYSYADGYLSLCTNCLSKFVRSGIVKFNKLGKVRTYNNEDLKNRETEVKGIPWVAEMFCCECELIRKHNGKSFWRKDMNHLFIGNCSDCSNGVRAYRDEIRRSSK